jgi:hypothetical protein
LLVSNNASDHDEEIAQELESKLNQKSRKQRKNYLLLQRLRSRYIRVYIYGKPRGLRQ